MLKSMKCKLGVLSGLAMLLSSASAFAYGGFAAIVYNPANHAFGSYHGANSRYEAEANALSYCGNGCAGVTVEALEGGYSGLKETWARNGWVALAVGNGHWGTGGVHYDEASAEQSALQNCGGDYNGCYVMRSVSSYVNSPDIDGVRP